MGITQQAKMGFPRLASNDLRPAAKRGHSNRLPLQMSGEKKFRPGGYKCLFFCRLTDEAWEISPERYIMVWGFQNGKGIFNYEQCISSVAVTRIGTCLMKIGAYRFACSPSHCGVLRMPKECDTERGEKIRLEKGKRSAFFAFAKISSLASSLFLRNLRKI